MHAAGDWELWRVGCACRPATRANAQVLERLRPRPVVSDLRPSSWGDPLRCWLAVRFPGRVVAAGWYAALSSVFVRWLAAENLRRYWCYGRWLAPVSVLATLRTETGARRRLDWMAMLPRSLDPAVALVRLRGSRSCGVRVSARFVRALRDEMHTTVVWLLSMACRYSGAMCVLHAAILRMKALCRHSRSIVPTLWEASVECCLFCAASCRVPTT